MAATENVNLPLLTYGADGAFNYKDWASVVFRIYQSKKVEGCLSHIIKGKGKGLPVARLTFMTTSAEKQTYEEELEN